MKIKQLFFITSFLMVSVAAQAQFEGQVSMNIYNVEDGVVKEANEVNLYVTKNRVLIKGEDNIDFSNGLMKAEGLLIRHDMKDFVIMMGEDEALRFTKEELEGFFGMFSMMSQENDMGYDDTNTTFKYTNEVRTINGMKATELQVWSEEMEGYLSIWITNEIDINWGILAEPWQNVPGAFQKSTLTMTQEFKSRNFPVLVEVHEVGKSYKVFEVTNVRESRIAKDMVEIPENITLVSLQTLFMKAMMDQ